MATRPRTSIITSLTPTGPILTTPLAACVACGLAEEAELARRVGELTEVTVELEWMEVLLLCGRPVTVLLVMKVAVAVTVLVIAVVDILFV